jgi:hypothetical protein
MLSELNYGLQYLIIDVKNAKIKEINIDERPIIRLSGVALFQYCLQNGLIDDVGFYDKMIKECRTQK